MQPIATTINNMRQRPTVAHPAPADYDPFDDVRPIAWSRLDDLDTSHPLVKAAVDAARVWARRYNAGSSDRATWLVLSGPNGVGKTHVARSIWSSFYRTVDYDDLAGRPEKVRRPTARFLTAADAMAELEDRREADDVVSVARVVGSAPLIVIDDVGAEGVLPYVGKEQQEYERQMRYFRLLDFCYDRNNRIPGVITSNLTLAELAAHLGRRAWDRLMQMAPAGQMVDMGGVPSWRVKAGGR